jgi:hypothetical protein
MMAEAGDQRRLFVMACIPVCERKRLAISDHRWSILFFPALPATRPHRVGRAVARLTSDRLLPELFRSATVHSWSHLTVTGSPSMSPYVPGVA